MAESSQPVLPYNLRLEENSDRFYQKAEDAASFCLSELKPLCDKIITDFRKYMEKNNVEQLRSDDEYFIEIVSAGIFIHNYLTFSLSSPLVLISAMKVLTYLRKYSFLKHTIDTVRGKIISRYLSKDCRPSKLTAHSYKRLLLYLDAIGDLKEETGRLKNWYNFLRKTYYPFSDYKGLCEKVSTLFVKEMSQRFGEYTAGVDIFNEMKSEFYHDREDKLYCIRKKNEYYLNIVCAEILNRAFRSEFDQSSTKIVMLPTCMRKPDARCKAGRGPEIKCAKCDVHCTICRISTLCESRGFQTRLIPHSSDFSRTLKHWKNDKSVGLVGIACILNLLRGGYEMRKLGIPSQCVFLDWAGCRGHWNECGVATDINNSRLLHVLQGR